MAIPGPIKLRVLKRRRALHSLISSQIRNNTNVTIAQVESIRRRTPLAKHGIPGRIPKRAK